MATKRKAVKKVAKKGSKKAAKPSTHEIVMLELAKLREEVARFTNDQLIASVNRRAETHAVTVGRIVLYALNEGQNAGQLRPAVICRVWNDTSVNLRVLSDGANDMLSSEWISSATRETEFHEGKIAGRQWAFPAEWADAQKRLVNVLKPTPTPEGLELLGGTQASAQDNLIKN